MKVCQATSGGKEDERAKKKSLTEPFGIEVCEMQPSDGGEIQSILGILVKDSTEHYNMCMYNIIM